QAVQQHYGGMYENVLRVQNEMNLPEQSAAANLDAGFEGKLENANHVAILPLSKRSRAEEASYMGRRAIQVHDIQESSKI
ncbi:hypothetical protein Tcan_01049, partial [Toxocara canis]